MAVRAMPNRTTGIDFRLGWILLPTGRRIAASALPFPPTLAATSGPTPATSSARSSHLS